MKKLEQIGAGMSLLCALHCAVMPLLVAMLPLIGHDLEELFHTHGIEAAVIGIAGAIGYVTLAFGVRRHRRLAPLAILTLGLLLIVFAHALLAHDAARLPTVVGALMLAGAQLLNRRYLSGCCVEERSLDAAVN